MRFAIHTTYSRSAMVVMARTMRKTLRRKKSIRSMVIACVVVVLSVLLAWMRMQSDGKLTPGSWVTLLIALALVVTTFAQDYMNGWITRKQILPGMDEIEAVFTEEDFCSGTKNATTHWTYDQIKAAYETRDYFVFFLSSRHGQVYDKQGFREGTPEEFRAFIGEIIGEPVKFVS